MNGPAKFLSDLPRPAQLLIAALIGGGGVAAVTLYGSWMLGAIVVAGVLLIAVLLLALHLISSFIAKRRARGFGDDLLRDIGRKFDTGLDTFKANDKSIYSLPWYVMVGEPGAGKTEAIRHSNIGFPNGLNKPAQGQGGTVNMDWWFARKAVLLDTAGRLMFEATDEWRSFLQMLRQHRPQTPINGMILAIPAPSLLTDTADQIAEKATQISQQFEAVQRELGVRFPVYVLITKADMIAGFREYFYNLPDPTAQNQILGWSNPDNLDQPFQPELVDQHLATVSRRLQRKKLAMMLSPATVQENSSRRLEQVDALYAFPTEITRLSSRLRMYLDTIFMPSEWSLKPLFLRGIYFTSAMSEGTALDLDLAEAFGIAPAELPVEMQIFGREKSYFLKDFFLEKCFPEGGLVTTAKNVSREINRRRLTVFSAITLAACALIAATLYGQIALRQTVSKPAAFWKTLADSQEKDPTGKDFAIVDPHTGVYRGEEKLPRALGGDTAALFDTAQKQDAITVPLIFKPWDSAATGLDPLRRTAHRYLFEYGILRPVITASQLKLTDPKNALNPLAITAAGQILPLVPSDSGATGSATTLALDPLLKFLLPNQFDSLPPTFKQLPHASTVGSYKSAGLPFPPADLLDLNVDTARVLLQKLQSQATQVATEARALSDLLAKLSITHNCEIALLQMPWSVNDPNGDLSGHLIAWGQKLDALSQASKDSDAALAASGLPGAYQDPDAQVGILQRQYDKIVKDQQMTDDTFTAFSTQNNLPQIQDAHRLSTTTIKSAIEGLNESIALLSNQDSGQPLVWLEQSYLLHDALHLRLSAYADQTTQLDVKPGDTAPPTWVNFTDLQSKLSLVPSAVDVHSQLDKQANDELKLASAYALAHQRLLIQQKVAQSFPKDAAAWGAIVMATAKAAGGPQQIDPLPLTSQESVAIDPQFDSRAAAAVMKSWGNFLNDWTSSVSTTADQQSQVQAANDSLQQYAEQYRDYWIRDVQSDPKILPFSNWESARNEILSDDFPQNIQTALARADSTRGDAVRTLAQPCSEIGTFKSILIAPPHAVSKVSTDIASGWKNIAQGRNSVEQARTLLQTDPGKLFTLANSQDDSDARYWKNLSLQFLLAIEEPAKAASDATLDQVKSQLDRFPISFPGTGPVLTVAQVRVLRNDISTLMTGHSAQAPANRDINPLAEASLRRIALGSHTSVYRNAELKSATLDLLAKSFSANLYLMPDKLMTNLPGGAGPAFASATYVSNVPGEDPSTQGWPDTDSVLAGHCDFPNDQLKVSIQFDGKNTTVLPGGAWWPFVLLKIGTPVPVEGETNSWFVRVPVTVTGQTNSGKWLKLEIRGSKQAVENPWP